MAMYMIKYRTMVGLTFEARTAPNAIEAKSEKLLLGEFHFLLVDADLDGESEFEFGENTFRVGDFYNGRTYTPPEVEYLCE